MSRRLAVIALLAMALSVAFGSWADAAQSRAHVYLFRGLADVFSTGMDTLTDELNRRGIYATSHSHTDWRALADNAAAAYKAGKEGPIILIGHSLGADAVMEMADYLGDKGVPVALVMPFDGTQSFPASANISRVVNFTQRDYAYMRKGPGFRGTLVNVDVSSDPDIGHLNIDKSPRLHARAISEALAVASGHMGPPPVADKPGVTPLSPSVTIGNVRREGSGKTEEPHSGERAVEREAPAVSGPAKTGPARTEEGGAATKPETSASAPAIVAPQAPAAPVSPVFPPQPPPPRPAPVKPALVKPLEIPD
jgi:Thioesterase domain